MSLMDKARADRVIRFIEMLPINDGPAVGQPIKLDAWEENWIREIYEPVKENGKPLVTRAVLSVARKNRKSLLVSCLLLVHLIGPEAQINGQIYSCAVDQKQAKVIFNMVKQMLELRPALKEYIQVYPSTSRMVVTRSDVRGSGSVYHALSAKAESKHGLGADFFVYDEFGEAPNENLWNVMYDSQQLRARPLAVVISTQTNDPQHPLSLMIDAGLAHDDDGNKIDPTTVCHLYAADEDCDLDDPEQWLKANPTLATWKTPDQLATAAKEAMLTPTKEANFRLRYLNQRVNAFATLISQSSWKACRVDAVEFERGEPVYLALDMSYRVDLTALTMVSAGPTIRTKSWFWKPAALLAEHAKRDRAAYDVWARQGLLETCPGEIITPRLIALKIAELYETYDVRGLAFDRYHTSELLGHFDDIGLAVTKDDDAYGALKLVEWGQGFRDMSPAVTAFEEAVVTKTLVHDSHPIQNMCVMNAMVVMDPAGNRKLDKSASRFRIDGAVTLAMALALKVREGNKAPPVSPWEDPDFSISRL
ncbi:terminase large subunit [Novosphingobium sp. FGD1]|uniref:Terminase large subunit n=2 Tax=Novosphingobium silvae TaxID=2692619 RepID=A0A7X4GHN0_9SPHN|nr:terminase large subunit [Novosphingobium silvae]